MSHPRDENDEVFVRSESGRLGQEPASAQGTDAQSYPLASPENEIVEPLPDEVQRFLGANIDSVDQLEILRVLGENPDREWLASDLARETQTAPQRISADLALLQERGLLILQTQGPDLFCRYGPRNPELAEHVARLLQVYRERPVTMIRLVYASARDPLKSFADAFRLKKEK